MTISVQWFMSHLEGRGIISFAVSLAPRTVLGIEWAQNKCLPSLCLLKEEMPEAGRKWLSIPRALGTAGQLTPGGAPPPACKPPAQSDSSSCFPTSERACQLSGPDRDRGGEVGA